MKLVALACVINDFRATPFHSFVKRQVHTENTFSKLTNEEVINRTMLKFH